MRRFLCVVIAHLALFNSIPESRCGQEIEKQRTSVSDKQRHKQTAPVPIDFSKLVGSLRNENEPPQTRGGDAHFEDDYDFNEQRRIHKAIATLTLYAEEAWPELIDGLESEQYSYTIGFGYGASNFSVGQVCEQIIRNTLFASYSRSVELLGDSKVTLRELADPTIRERTDLSNWLKAQGKTSLVDLQISTIHRVCSNLEKLDIPPKQKTAFEKSALQGADRLKKTGIAKLGSAFIPRKEQWTYFTKEDEDK